MGVISFSDRAENIWCVAGWAFRQILEDVLAQNQNDHEMADQFERAILVSGLILRSLDRALADRITASIREVASGILSGSIQSKIIEQPYGDAETVRQYHESLKELLEMASRA
jgi:hypothetical protein